MTFTYESNLGVLKMYLHTKDDISRSKLSKVRAQMGWTDGTEHIPHYICDT